MSEEDKKKQDETPEEAAETKKKSKGPLLFIIIAAVVFIGGVGGFSVFMGVFSSEPTAETETAPDSLADHAAVDSIPVDDDLSELDKLEREIFGESDAVNAEDLDELLEQASERESQLASEDSVAMTPWLESEKAKLATERADLEALKKTIEAREYHLRQLIAQVNQVRATRITALAKLYDGMKPAQVAPLISKLSDEQAIQVLMKMKTASAAKILGVLNTDRAARISANMLTFSEEK